MEKPAWWPRDAAGNPLIPTEEQGRGWPTYPDGTPKIPDITMSPEESASFYRGRRVNVTDLLFAARTARLEAAQKELAIEHQKLKAMVEDHSLKLKAGGITTGKTQTEKANERKTEALRIAKLLPGRGAGVSLDDFATDIHFAWKDGDPPAIRTMTPWLSQWRKDGTLPPK